MTVADIQQRIQSLQARFLAAPVTVPPAGADGSRTADAFAAALDRATGAGALTGILGGDAAGPVGANFDGNGVNGNGVDGNTVVSTALAYQGVPYRWGGESPDGFDCSGLVQHVFARNGVDLPRVAKDQAQAGTAVATADLRPGDLVFFGQPVDHVGIYAGGGKMIAAPHTGDVVKVQSFDPSTVTAARRVLPDRSAAVLASLGSTSATGSTGSASWADRLPPAGRRFAGAIERAATAAGIDPRLLAALTWSESGFNPAAVSGSGAVGLTQLMPGTAQGLGVDPSDPYQNLVGGARYLAGQIQRFGRVDHALAAYNAGPTAVVKAGGVPPYPETQSYVARVLDRLHSL